jgi:hypothetical protein
MRKSERTNNAAAIAISAAIGSSETNNAQGAFDPKVDIALNSPESSTAHPNSVADTT